MSHDQYIQSLKRRLLIHSVPKNECLIWTLSLNERGYGIITFFKGKTLLTHRASWLIHYGNLPKNLVLHTCDIRNCININHLKEGTNQDNTDDMMKKNRYKMPTHYKGSKNGNAILQEEVVLEIKKLLKEEKNMAEVSKILNQPYSRVSDIKYKRIWSHL